ncbi:DUF1697 domain-containing protein [Serinicoccus kebangsaanensis]|uniref:DUF1697 domain-containing protein n=1 Tax=Serinicoccus kebangsaanensis TaxID=2602069 RepID=UPI00124E341C|nr:DUF1697 domain-containing protein [Serinicoccus kebangsaanensis]
MPTYIAFLRAINLGARRKFPKDDIVRVTEQAGFGEVATYINTGNVRLETRRRSRARIEEALEAAYLADRGFEVPTIAYAVPELRDLAADIEELGAGHTGQHHLVLLKDTPTPAAVRAAESVRGDGERLVLRGRAAHLLIGDSFHTSTLSNAAIEKVLGDGVGTTRSAKVVRTVTERWC